MRFVYSAQPACTQSGIRVPTASSRRRKTNAVER
jgi:hypothetical protein